MTFGLRKNKLYIKRSVTIMGLIKALMGSAGGVLADQWKEYFYCDAIGENVLGVKGKKRVSGRSSNKRGSDNLISNGSVIAVADGCLLYTSPSPRDLRLSRMPSSA